MLCKTFELKLHRFRSNVGFLENLLASQAEGLKFTKHIIVSMPGDDLGAPIDPCEDEDRLDLGDEEGWDETKDGLGQMHHQPRVLNTLMRILLNKMPSNQLRSFQ